LLTAYNIFTVTYILKYLWESSLIAAVLAVYKINKPETLYAWTEFKSDKTGSVLQQPICYGA
jgi:hypothetical protein